MEQEATQSKKRGTLVALNQRARKGEDIRTELQDLMKNYGTELLNLHDKTNKTEQQNYRIKKIGNCWNCAKALRDSQKAEAAVVASENTL